MDAITKILVTSATGKSGRVVVKELIKHGFAVRAMVRQYDERAEKLAQSGAEIVVADFKNYKSLLSALEGIDSAYMCYPVAEGITDATGLFAAAGKEKGLKRVVHLSVGSADPNHLSPHCRAQWVAERILDWAGFETIHIRVAAFFMENLFIHQQSIQQLSIIENPFGPFSPSWIATEDVGKMAASLLADPSRVNDSVIFPSGGENYSFAEVAKLMSEELKTAVVYQEILPEKWRKDLGVAVDAGLLNQRVVDHLVSQSIVLHDQPARPSNGYFKKLTGHDPLTLKSFIQSHKTLFSKINKS